MDASGDFTSEAKSYGLFYTPSYYTDKEKRDAGGCRILLSVKVTMQEIALKTAYFSVIPTY